MKFQRITAQMGLVAAPDSTLLDLARTCLRSLERWGPSERESTFARVVHLFEVGTHDDEAAQDADRLAETFDAERLDMYANVLREVVRRCADPAARVAERYAR